MTGATRPGGGELAAVVSFGGARHVHAHGVSPARTVVRYERTGQWWLERDGLPARRLSLEQAIDEAFFIDEAGGDVHFDIAGGEDFDDGVRGAMAASRVAADWRRFRKELTKRAAPEELLAEIVAAFAPAQVGGVYRCSCGGEARTSADDVVHAPRCAWHEGATAVGWTAGGAQAAGEALLS